MRKRGLSITAIAKKLRVSKSTASLWCRDIELTDAQIQRISEISKHHATISLLKASEFKRHARLSRMQEMRAIGLHDIGTLSKRDIFMIGLGLYWGEGYKKGNQELGFTNSDPLMIKFYITWLNTIYDISVDRLILRVSINTQHASRVPEVEKYWQNITKIPSNQFTKTSLIEAKTRKTYTRHENHFGTLRIKVRRGTDLRRRILGSISGLSK